MVPVPTPAERIHPSALASPIEDPIDFAQRPKEVAAPPRTSPDHLDKAARTYVTTTLASTVPGKGLGQVFTRGTTSAPFFNHRQGSNTSEFEDADTSDDNDADSFPVVLIVIILVTMAVLAMAWLVCVCGRRKRAEDAPVDDAEGGMSFSAAARTLGRRRSSCTIFREEIGMAALDNIDRCNAAYSTTIDVSVPQVVYGLVHAESSHPRLNLHKEVGGERTRANPNYMHVPVPAGGERQPTHTNPLYASLGEEGHDHHDYLDLSLPAADDLDGQCVDGLYGELDDDFDFDPTYASVGDGPRTIANELYGSYDPHSSVGEPVYIDTDLSDIGTDLSGRRRSTLPRPSLETDPNGKGQSEFDTVGRMLSGLSAGMQRRESHDSLYIFPTDESTPALISFSRDVGGWVDRESGDIYIDVDGEDDGMLSRLESEGIGCKLSAALAPPNADTMSFLRMMSDPTGAKSDSSSTFWKIPSHQRRQSELGVPFESASFHSGSGGFRVRSVRRSNPLFKKVHTALRQDSDPDVLSQLQGGGPQHVEACPSWEEPAQMSLPTASLPRKGAPGTPCTTTDLACAHGASGEPAYLELGFSVAAGDAHGTYMEVDPKSWEGETPAYAEATPSCPGNVVPVYIEASPESVAYTEASYVELDRISVEYATPSHCSSPDYE